VNGCAAKLTYKSDSFLFSGVDEGKTNVYKTSMYPDIICEDIHKSMSWMNTSNNQGFFWKTQADKSVLCCYDFVLGRVLWDSDPQDFDVYDIKSFELSGVLLMTSLRDHVLLHYISGEQAAKIDINHWQAWLYDRGLYILGVDGLIRFAPPYNEPQSIALPGDSPRSIAPNDNIPYAIGEGKVFFTLGGEILSYAEGDRAAKVLVSSNAGEKIICLSVADGCVIYAVKKGRAADILRVNAHSGMENDIARGVVLAVPKLCVSEGYLYTCEIVNGSSFFKQYPLSGGYLAESYERTLITRASRVFNYYAICFDYNGSESMLFVYISANSTQGVIEVCMLYGDSHKTRKVLKTCAIGSRLCLAAIGMNILLIDAVNGTVTNLSRRAGE
jgi:hypothetical protein